MLSLPVADRGAGCARGDEGESARGEDLAAPRVGTSLLREASAVDDGSRTLGCRGSSASQLLIEDDGTVSHTNTRRRKTVPKQEAHKFLTN